MKVIKRTESCMADAHKWRAIRLENEESVRYLNWMFARGWYLMDLGVDGLPYLNFTVPMKPMPVEYDQQPWIAVKMESIQIVILTNGKRKNIQKALVQMRDEKGYYDFSKEKQGIDMKVWEAMTSISLEEEGMVTIYQRKDAEGV
jgi:hypothetical protein